MGSTPIKQRPRLEIPQQQHQLDFYTDAIDPNLGPVKIYTTKKFNLCYILKYEQPHNQQDTKIYNTFKKIQQAQSSQLLCLYGFNIQRITCCNRICNQKVSSYWEYYNYYFNEYLNRRRIQRLPIIDTEIWHIVEACCETYILFKNHGIYYEINPETFVITPEGKLKAFWCHLRTHNNHIKFFQYFDSNFKISRFPYSPQQLECMHEQQSVSIIRQRTTKLDFHKCNSFRLGILLLECLTLTDPLSNCYNPSMTAINHYAIKNLIATRVSPHYSQEIVHLLNCLLREDPKKRPNLQEVQLEYQDRFSDQYELRVCGRMGDSGGQPENQNQGLLMDYNIDRQIQRMDQMGKKIGDFQDDKTVKFRRSIKHARK